MVIINACMQAQSLSCVWLFATPWTVACLAALSVEFSRQESWSRLPFLPPGDLPDPGIEPMSASSPALAGRFFFFFFYLWATPSNCESLLPSSSGDCLPGTLDNLSQRIFLRVVCMFHLSQYKMPSVYQNKHKNRNKRHTEKWVHEFAIIWP